MKKRIIVAVSIVIFVVLLPHMLHFGVTLLLSGSPYVACWNGTIVENKPGGAVVK